MAIVQTGGAYPQGKYTLVWKSGGTTLAAETWDAVNTSWDPLKELAGRVEVLEGLSVVFQTAPPRAAGKVLSLSGDGMPASTLERIAKRYLGIDGTQNWNYVDLFLTDEWGNEWQVKLGEAPAGLEPGRASCRYEMAFYVAAAPTDLIVGYC